MAGALDDAEVEETESLQTSAPKAPVTYERSVTTHDLNISKPRMATKPHLSVFEIFFLVLLQYT